MSECGLLRQKVGRLFALALVIALSVTALYGQMEGLWQGYDGEWLHVSKQLEELAEATPADKFSWRPAAGIRSVSEVYMHIAIANFALLSVTGVKMPAEITSNEMENTVKTKPEVIAWLKRSLEAVKTAHAGVTKAS
jgi:uncharacterized damage-inducible protein DinB